MNKFCVLSKNHKSYFIDRLIEEVGIRAVVVVNPFTSGELPHAGYYLPRTTGVYHDDNDLKLLSAILPGKVVNPLSTLNIFRSKLSQYAWFNEKKFLSLPYLNLQKSEPFEVEAFFELHSEVIIKPNFGQGGWGVRIVGLQEALRVYHSADSAYLLQPYIQDAVEVRYFFIKDRPPLIQKRIPTKGIAANFQNEGKAEIIDLDLNHRQQIEMVIEASGAIYGAIDCFTIDNDIYFLELNTVPGIEQAEKVSGRNLIKELLPIFS